MMSPAELGAALRAARETQKLALAEVSRLTGLPEKYLSALERGAYEDLPGRAYARLYFLNYARALNLNTEELMLSWPQTAYAPQPRALPEPRPAGRLKLLWIILLVVAVGAWGASRLLQVRVPGGDRTLATGAPGPAPTDTQATLAYDSSAAGSTVEGLLADSAAVRTTAEGGIDDSLAAGPVVAEPEPTPHRLQLTAHESSWVLVEADGDTVAAQVLEKGQTVNFEALHEFVLTILLPSQVDATLDLEPLKIPFSGTGALLRHRIPLSSQETGT